jgi:hypothetical protein
MIEAFIPLFLLASSQTSHVARTHRDEVAIHKRRRCLVAQHRQEKMRKCTHGFGIAGGFSECSACGIRKRKEK